MDRDEFSMRITGTLARHAVEQGKGAAQTGPEFVRSCIRKELERRGIDWQSERQVRAPAAAGELPGQVQLPPPVGAGPSLPPAAPELVGSTLQLSSMSADLQALIDKAKPADGDDPFGD